MVLCDTITQNEYALYSLLLSKIYIRWSLSPQEVKKMEKVMNSYETLFVVDASIGEDDVKATVEKFTALINENGSIDSIDEWGKRKLAYPINDKNEGYYVLVYFKSEGSFTSELERLFGINENILRSIVIRQIEDKKTRKDA